LVGNGDGTLKAAPLRRSGFVPTSFATGDFNGDGKLDLVTVSSVTPPPAGIGTGTVMLGNADGTFQAPKIWSTSAISSVAVGDFDGDGKLDLVETNPTPGNGNLSLLLGNGDGTFQPATNYAVGTTPEAVAVADLNGDGKPDVIVANRNSGNISVLLNGGNGSLVPAVDYATPATGTPESIAVGDFNGDGIPDIAVGISGINATSIAIFLNNGNGTFQPYISIPSGFFSSGIIHIVAADFDGDGNVDLAVTDGATLSVLLANGSASFNPVTYLVGAGAAINGTLLVADLNGDQKPDLVTSSRDGLAVFMNTGDGGFQAAIPFAPFLGGAIAVGDFDGIDNTIVGNVGDGRPDIVAADSVQDSTTTDTIAVIRNQSTGPQVTVTVQTSPTALPLSVYYQFPNGDAEFLGCTSPCTYNSSFGLWFQIYAGSTIAGSPGVQYAFDHFSDNGFTTQDCCGNLIHDVQVLAVPTTVTIFYKPQSIPVTPVITWPSPIAITYGTQLSGTQLDASAAVAGTTIAGTFAYSPVAGTVLPAGSHTLSVTFTPTDTTDYTTAMASVTLVVNPAPLVAVSATNLAFGSSLVGTATASKDVSLTNSGDAALAITSISVTGANASSFVFGNTCGTSLAAGASCSIHGHFAPTTTGAMLAAITITDNAADSPQSIALSGTGVGAPAVSLSATSLSFGNQAVGTTSTSQSVTLTNTGAGTLTISSIAVTGTNASAFAFSNSCGSILAAGANCTIHGHFAPTTTGAITAAITITDNATGSPQSIALTGTGVSPTTMSLSATSLPFGNVLVGSTSPSQSVTLTNTGSTTLTIGSISVTGTGAASFGFGNTCGSSLAAGANCTIHGHFAPTAAGAVTAAVTITDNATGSPQSIALTGTGVTPTTVSLSATSLSFGSVQVGSTSPSQSVTLTNTGSAALIINSITVTGTNASAFAFGNSCGTSLAAGANCSIHGHFAPTTAGPMTAAITISDTTTNSPQSIAITGTGVTATTVSLNPTSLSFGNQKVGTTSASQSVTLTNTGASALALTSITVTGTNASQFVFANSCGTSLAVGANCSIHGHFAPTTAGAMTAAVTLTDSATGSPQTITLSGTGQ
jgi:hypothetical protein